HLWSSTGSLLASVTFTGESASGWQQANFASPIAVTAGTTYLISYLTPVGHYAVDQNYFTATVDSSVLHASSSSSSGGNGVYVYTTTAAFPSSSYNASNYYVDVVFNSVIPPTATPTNTPTPGPSATPTSTS